MATFIQRINTHKIKEILLNKNRPERKSNGNYLSRYYFLKNNDEFEYKNSINDEDNKADICFDIIIYFQYFKYMNNIMKIKDQGNLVNNSEFNIIKRK